MILVDSSVWVEHLRRGEPGLAKLLRSAEVCSHPFVVGELACGQLRNRDELLGLLSALPHVQRAADTEVLAMIEGRRLHGKGLGYIDAHLLASCVLARTPLWTFDRRLARAAADAGVGS